MQAALGIIEGYYGAPWSWAARAETMSFLAPHGYGFYFYAPKSDPFLRSRWREDHPRETARHLGEFAAACRGLGVRFGVGLSPLEACLDFGRDERAALARKLTFFAEIGVEDLAILFDDMRGESANLAARQADIAHWISERSSAKNFALCPTYYSDDPALDRLFGQRPPDYLEELGARLDPSIDIFWTGEEVCARAFASGHLDRVARALGRKPLLWDNYPVNDGARMSQYLHLRGFTGRPQSLAGRIAAHAINPSLQPVLFRIPALTLAEAYRLGDDYEYARAMESAAAAVAGPRLARMMREDVALLQDTGLDRLHGAKERLRARYGAFDHPAAQEIIAWLDGAYRVADELAAS
ncbi:MAG TPA: beta-N-acetylglucosaminidase domain-containing protein [Rhizomicrobium sp.]|nr:beta-N-acetylglucosaminidase domain-containing protein [Rhizomicrobium sp.]